MRSIEALIAAVRCEAQRADFPVDRAVYERSGKAPLDPILFAGNLDAPVCVFGRDLGKDEVAHGQPLIGAGGRLVRRGLLAAHGHATERADDPWLEAALEFALLTNTVPFKPPGNKAYSEPVKARFRPFVAELLGEHWAGGRVLTLGNEAFGWFTPYAQPGAAEAFWAREDRYEADLPVTLSLEVDGRTIRKALTVCPLPHPSPLNARWYARFPELLGARLGAARC